MCACMLYVCMYVCTYVYVYLYAYIYGGLFVVQLLCMASVVAHHGPLIQSTIHMHNLQRLPLICLEEIRDD